MKKAKRIAILTSGGDAPGMNAAVRGAVRAALNKGWEVYAVKEGYRGLLTGGENIFPLDWVDVSWNFREGGTFLGGGVLGLGLGFPVTLHLYLPNSSGEPDGGPG